MEQRTVVRFHTPVTRQRIEPQLYFNKDLAPLLDFQRPIVAQLRTIAQQNPNLSRWINQILDRIHNDLYIYEGTHSQIMRAARKLGVPQKSVFRHISTEKKSEFIRPLTSQRDGTSFERSTVSEHSEPYTNGCDDPFGSWESEDRNGSFITTKKNRHPLRDTGLIQPFPLVAPSKKEWLCCGLPYIHGDSQSNGCWISDSNVQRPIPYELFPELPENPSKTELKAYLERTTVQKGTAWLDKEYFDGMHEEISGGRETVAMTLWNIANNGGSVSTMDLNTTAKVYGLIDRYNDPHRPDKGPEAPRFLGGDPTAWLSFITTKAYTVMNPKDSIPPSSSINDMTIVQISNPKRDAEPFFPQPALPQLFFDGKSWKFDLRPLKPDQIIIMEDKGKEEQEQERQKEAEEEEEAEQQRLEAERRKQEEEEERARQLKADDEAEQQRLEAQRRKQQEEKEEERARQLKAEETARQKQLEAERQKEEEQERQKEAEETARQERAEKRAEKKRIRRGVRDMHDYVAVAKRLEASNDIVNAVNAAIKIKREEFIQRNNIRSIQNLEEREAILDAIQIDIAKKIKAASDAVGDISADIVPISEKELKWLYRLGVKNKIPLDKKARLVWVLENHWEFRQWQVTKTTEKDWLNIFNDLKDNYELLKAEGATPDLELAQNNLDKAVLAAEKAFGKPPSSVDPINVADWQKLLGGKLNPS